MDIVKKAGYREPSAKIDSNGYSVERVYSVSNVDYSDDMEMRILTNSEIPQRLDPLSSSYPTIVVDSVTVDVVDDVNFSQWEVTVTYKNEDQVDDNDSSTDPDGWSKDLTTTTRVQQYEVALDKAYDDENELTVPIQSTTYEPIIGTTGYKSNLIVDINYNVADFDEDWLLEYTNVTNNKNMTVAGINVGVDKLRILEINPQPNTDATGEDYYNVTISVEITKDDFLSRPMNVGYKKNTGQTSIIQMTDLEYILKKDVSGEDGDTGEERIDEPAKLSDTGQVITDDKAIYLSFKTLRSVNLDPLDLPVNKAVSTGSVNYQTAFD